MARLDGQVAVVTGAGSGIGEATALAFGQAGARVALVGRRVEPLTSVAARIEADTMVYAGDVTDAAAMDGLVDAVTARWGRLDVLVNNAGMNVPVRALADVSRADWQAVVDVNLGGTFLLTQAVLPIMRRQRSGTIVNVSSIAGRTPFLLSGPAYSAAKAAVNSFTESVNLVEREYGIRACAICPGEVHTPIMANRPTPPSAEALATMLQPADLAETILLVAGLPQRAAIELVQIMPTIRRDTSSG
ncbi:MAG: SDR family oxidoreductase [Actinomycetota bacterium]|nr:SDR family oxidoreductase [Actinomycetota bacterium]